MKLVPSVNISNLMCGPNFDVSATLSSLTQATIRENSALERPFKFLAMGVPGEISAISHLRSLAVVFGFVSDTINLNSIYNC